MSNKKILAGFSILLTLIIGIVIANPWAQYKVKLFESGSGWGYDIMAGRKPYIHQPFIPVIEGEVPFNDKRSARKTGRLVIQKLRKHHSPALTREELESLFTLN
jgi:hypothetical protein